MTPKGGPTPVFPVAEGPQGTRLAVPAAWAAWLALFLSFGFRGLNLLEDGYLLTLGERVLRGEVPYRDFAYIRPPLPIAIQATLLRSIPGYALAESRWYFGLQVSLILLVVAALLARVTRDRVLPALYALCAVIFAFTGGFPPMPWHTVDGICFSLMATWALVLAVERRSALLAGGAGLAAAAAALSKQGFAVVLFIGFLLTLAPLGRRMGSRPSRAPLAYVGGAGLAAAVTVGYLVWHAALAPAVQSILLDPREITREVSVLRLGPWGLLVGMHLPSASGAIVGLAALALVALPMPSVVRLGLLLGGLAVVAAAFFGWGYLVNRLVLVEALSTVTWLGGLGLLAARLARRLDVAPSVAVLLGLGLSTLYAATWSYAPRISAAQGLVLGLPVVLLATSALEIGADAGATRRARRLAGGCLLLYAAFQSALLQAPWPAWAGDGMAAFTSARLRGIRAASPRVRGVDAVVALVRRETAPSDYVLAFMNFPALYFLAERRNPTRVDWYIPIELTMGEVRRALADLAARPPRLVILNARDPRPMVESPRLRPVLGHILEHYEQGEAIGEFLVYRLRR